MLSTRTIRSIATLVAAIAMGLAGSAAHADAAVPRDTWIAAEATFLSGRPATVVCASNAAEWRRALVGVGFSPSPAGEYYGFSLIEGSAMYLSPYVCEGLRLGRVASWRRQHELQVSWSVDVLIHESVHLGRSTTDEALTEACARNGLPLELHRLYGLAYRSGELARLANGATWFRRTQLAAYQGGSCPSA